MGRSAAEEEEEEEEEGASGGQRQRLTLVLDVDRSASQGGAGALAAPVRDHVVVELCFDGVAIIVKVGQDLAAQAGRIRAARPVGEGRTVRQLILDVAEAA